MPSHLNGHLCRYRFFGCKFLSFRILKAPFHPLLVFIAPLEKCRTVMIAVILYVTFVPLEICIYFFVPGALKFPNNALQHRFTFIHLLGTQWALSVWKLMSFNCPYMISLSTSFPLTLFIAFLEHLLLKYCASWPSTPVLSFPFFPLRSVRPQKLQFKYIQFKEFPQGTCSLQ